MFKLLIDENLDQCVLRELQLNVSNIAFTP